MKKTPKSVDNLEKLSENGDKCHDIENKGHVEKDAVWPQTSWSGKSKKQKASSSVAKCLREKENNDDKTSGTVDNAKNVGERLIEKNKTKSVDNLEK